MNELMKTPNDAIHKCWALMELRAHYLKHAVVVANSAMTGGEDSQKFISGYGLARKQAIFRIIQADRCRRRAETLFASIDPESLELPEWQELKEQFKEINL